MEVTDVVTGFVTVDRLRLHGEHEDTIKTELHPVQEHDTQRMVEAAPLDEVNLDVAALEEAVLDRLLAVQPMLELDEEGLQMIPGDDDLLLAQLELVAECRCDVACSSTQWHAYHPGDDRRVLPVMEINVDGERGGHEHGFSCLAWQRGQKLLFPEAARWHARSSGIAQRQSRGYSSPALTRSRWSDDLSVVKWGIWRDLNASYLAYALVVGMRQAVGDAGRGSSLDPALASTPRERRSSGGAPLKRVSCGTMGHHIASLRGWRINGVVPPKLLSGGAAGCPIARWQAMEVTAGMSGRAGRSYCSYPLLAQ
uniref:Uncharacterized protein n=1 Tax=Setaria viridis TaxID=4556 RepID=A0A4U6TS08_SETVI|nr:hypothetical protein SEVIR_7G175700v2 [Setaria viridis]